MSGFTLDSGALIGAERGNMRAIALLDRFARRAADLALPAGVLAQVWRADPRQHRLHRLLLDEKLELVSLDRDESLRVGTLCARTGASDVVDGSVASCAQQRQHAVVTSDPEDIARFDPSLPLVVV